MPRCPLRSPARSAARTECVFGSSFPPWAAVRPVHGSGAAMQKHTPKSHGRQVLGVVTLARATRGLIDNFRTQWCPAAVSAPARPCDCLMSSEAQSTMSAYFHYRILRLMHVCMWTCCPGNDSGAVEQASHSYCSESRRVTAARSRVLDLAEGFAAYGTRGKARGKARIEGADVVKASACTSRVRSASVPRRGSAPGDRGQGHSRVRGRMVARSLSHVLAAEDMRVRYRKPPRRSAGPTAFPIPRQLVREAGGFRR